MNDSTKPKIIAVIPCLNEQDFIRDVVTRTRKYTDEVIVVDDGSTDDTSGIARAAGAQVIKHKTSRGAGAATKDGFNAAKKGNADIVVTLDGDGQHNPDEMPRLLAPIIDAKADMVIGSRFIEPQTNIRRYRKFGIDVITFLYNFGSKVTITDSQSGFRAHSRKLLESINITEDSFGFSVQVLIQARRKGMIITEVPISCIYHSQGSTLNPVRHGISVALTVVKLRLRRS
ncbi:MAG TPA: glycosyl hydrolase [Dehalococcoidia bacterium]|nr:glycosyl hydrolase [Dehalococcoidia bacterium]